MPLKITEEEAPVIPFNTFVVGKVLQMYPSRFPILDYTNILDAALKNAVVTNVD